MMKVAITLSAFNEAANLGSVVERARRYGTVIVVDDGSQDESVEVARRHGAQVVQHPINLGQGAAVVTGFVAALKGDFDVIVEMDADGQHDPDEIPKFLKCLQETQVDVVVGSRVLGRNYRGAPLMRRVFLRPLTWFINLLTGYRMTDSMCGFRSFKASSLRMVRHVLLEMWEAQYLAAEMFIRFSRAGLTMGEVPITLADRRTGMSYKGTIRYGWGIARAILQTILKRRW